MGFLSDIVESKRGEVLRLKAVRGELDRRLTDAPFPRDFAAALRRSDAPSTPRVIAEVKYRSPSKGLLRPRGDPAWLAERYERAGARAISVLCDAPYFAGSFTDLELVRASTSLPVLCKEFVLDEVQVVRARAAGADAVLLIARIVPDGTLGELASTVRALGMEPLFEVANIAELDRVLPLEPSVVGVNARDLETFAVDKAAFSQVLPHVPRSSVAVAMSGMSSIAEIRRLAAGRADAVLVGERLMSAPDPGEALRELLEG